MSTKEIYDVLGIDIKIDKRALHYVYVKNIYINQEYEKSHTLQKIGYDLDLTHATILNSIRRNAIYHKNPMFKEILVAYQAKDRDLFEAAIGKVLKRDYSTRNIPSRERKPKDRPKERWHSSKIYEALRNHQTSHLWNVPMNEMTKKDYALMQKMLDGTE